MKRNCNEREDAVAHPMDGYEMLMQFIVRQYRRGIRVGVALELLHVRHMEVAY